ncbi:MAG: leucine-rich repeat protein, partial [Tannerella sp.]|nr:leucine-rich repeat protein [Tannerella sp.]
FAPFKTIGDRAFAGCETLSYAGFGKNLESLGSEAFAGCSALERVEIEVTPQNMGERIFTGCSKLIDVLLGYNVSRISRGAFEGCTALTSIGFSERLTTIEENAFAGCAKLRSITLPGHFESLKEGAFAGCAALESVSISAKAAVAPGAFEGCDKIKNIELTGNKIKPLAWIAKLAKDKRPRVSFKGDFKIIGDNAFRDCEFLMLLDIEKICGSLTSIGENAFAGLAGLQKITFNYNLKEIKNGAFEGCTNLKTVTFYGDDRDNKRPLKTIGDRAFAGCTSLVSIKIPPNVEAIGPDAFAGCDNLKNIEISSTTRKLYHEKAIILNHPSVGIFPPDAESIDDCAFQNQSGVKSIKIPDGVTTIGEAAFEGCTGLESIALPQKLEYIKKRAFRGCAALKSITLPESVCSIEEDAFKNCTGLTDLVIPGNKNLVIEREAFAGCTGIREITVLSNSVTLFASASGIFMGCSGLKKITFPPSKEFSDTVSIGDRTFMGCTSLESITFPHCSICLGAEAFAGCSALREIENLCTGGNPRKTESYVYPFPPNTFENVFKGTPFLEHEKGSRCMYCGWKLSLFKKCKNKHCGTNQRTKEEEKKHARRKTRRQMTIIATIMLLCAFFFWYFLIPFGEIRYVEKKFVPAHEETKTSSVPTGGVTGRGRPRTKTTSRKVEVPDKWYLIVADKKNVTFQLEITRVQYKSDWLKDKVWTDYNAFQNEFHGKTDYLSKATGVAGFKDGLKGVVSLVFKDVRGKYGMANICGFALYCDEDAREVSVAVNTYEHYNSYATRNPAYQSYLKFYPKEWDIKPSSNDLYKINDRLLYTSVDTKKKEQAEYRDNVYKMCLEILEELKKENLFKGAKKDFVLMFSVINGDIPETVIEFNKKHNSKETVNEYEQWLLKKK